MFFFSFVFFLRFSYANPAPHSQHVSCSPFGLKSGWQTVSTTYATYKFYFSFHGKQIHLETYQLFVSRLTVKQLLDYIWNDFKVISKEIHVYIIAKKILEIKCLPKHLHDFCCYIFQYNKNVFSFFFFFFTLARLTFPDLLISQVFSCYFKHQAKLIVCSYKRHSPYILLFKLALGLGLGT